MTTDLAHDTLTFERHFPHPPTAVFDAYADIDQRVIWSAPSDDEVVIFESADFTVGGTDRFLCGLDDAPSFAGTTQYHAIIDGSRHGYDAMLDQLERHLGRP